MTVIADRDDKVNDSCAPRNRYVSWQASMLRPINNKVNQFETMPFASPHYSNYYVQEEADDGVVMESSLSVKDVSIFSCRFNANALFNCNFLSYRRPNNFMLYAKDSCLECS